MRDHRMGNPRHSQGRHTNTWITPPFIIDALGKFDLDPCAASPQPYPTAEHAFTVEDDGLRQEWFGRVWLNPPYSLTLLGAFLARMAEHDCGTALIFAKTETEAFFRHVWERASGLLFIKSRLHFLDVHGSPAPYNAGAPSVLVAYGSQDLDILASEPIEGKFIPLLIPQGFILSRCEPTPTSWREAVESILSSKEGPVKLSTLYALLRDHSPQNRHPEAKIRQTLKRGQQFKNVGPGVWALA